MDRATPTPAGVAYRWRAIGANFEHTCGITDGGRTYCWGSGTFGRLGNGDPANADALAPVEVAGGRSFVQLGAGGGDHSCAVAAGGEMYCWGVGHSGILGTGDLNDANQPQRVDATRTWSAVTTGGNHNCAITTTGQVYCWGFNIHGQVGASTAADPCIGTTCANTPQLIDGGRSYLQVGVGAAHSCAVDSGGVALCWGYNQYGQVGDGTVADALAPVPVGTSLRFAEVVAGGGHSCGRTSAGDVYCWGDNEEGQLGNGAANVGTPGTEAAPVQVVGDHAFRSISLGCVHSCGVTFDDEIYCWGSGYTGQLGVATTPSTCSNFGSNPNYPCSSTPVLVLDGAMP